MVACKQVHAPCKIFLLQQIVSLVSVEFYAVSWNAGGLWKMSDLRKGLSQMTNICLMLFL